MPRQKLVICCLRQTASTAQAVAENPVSIVDFPVKDDWVGSGAQGPLGVDSKGTGMGTRDEFVMRMKLHVRLHSV